MRPALITLLLLVAPAVAGAYPQVDISWTGCDGGGPLETYSRAEHVATISLVGAEGDYDGFELVLAIDDRCEGARGATYPDAWRFDGDGCQSGMLTVTRPRSLGACPGISSLGVSYSTTEFGTVLEFYGGPENVVAHVPALLVHIGEAFASRHFDPGTRYVLAQLHFDMTNTTGTYDPSGVLCGCGASKEEIKLISGGFTPLAIANPVSSGNSAFWNEYFGCMIAPSGPPGLAQPAPACVPVPAQATSWGQLRASYR